MIERQRYAEACSAAADMDLDSAERDALARGFEQGLDLYLSVEQRDLLAQGIPSGDDAGAWQVTVEHRGPPGFLVQLQPPSLSVDYEYVELGWTAPDALPAVVDPEPEKPALEPVPELVALPTDYPEETIEYGCTGGSQGVLHDIVGALLLQRPPGPRVCKHRPETRAEWRARVDPIRARDEAQHRHSVVRRGEVERDNVARAQRYAADHGAWVSRARARTSAYGIECSGPARVDAQDTTLNLEPGARCVWHTWTAARVASGRRPGDSSEPTRQIDLSYRVVPGDCPGFAVGRTLPLAGDAWDRLAAAPARLAELGGSHRSPRYDGAWPAPGSGRSVAAVPPADGRPRDGTPSFVVAEVEQPSAVCAAGDRLFATAAGGELWEMARGGAARRWPLRGRPQSLACRGPHVVAAGWYGLERRTDAGWQEVEPPGCRHDEPAIGLAPDGTAYVACDGGIVRWRGDTTTLLPSQGHETVTSVAVTTSGRVFATSEGYGATPPPLRELRDERLVPYELPEALAGGTIEAVWAHPTRETLWLGLRTAGAVSLDLATGVVVKHPTMGSSAFFATAGDTMVVANTASLELLDGDGGLRRIHGGYESISGLYLDEATGVVIVAGGAALHLVPLAAARTPAPN